MRLRVGVKKLMSTYLGQAIQELLNCRRRYLL
jgi:hypothetical protein